MRITGGELKGLHVPDTKLNLRPTTNKAKQALFNILNNRIQWETCDALELFAGTGSISFELASRGAKTITAVDIDRQNCKLIRQNADSLKLPLIRTVHADAVTFLRNTKEKWSLIIADPPYNYRHYELLLKLIFEKHLLREDGLLVVEHSRRTNFGALPFFTEQRKYGEVNFSFFDEKDRAGTV